jgi:hypothetical protein
MTRGFPAKAVVLIGEPAWRQAFRIAFLQFVRLIEQAKSFKGNVLKERKLWLARCAPI